MYVYFLYICQSWIETTLHKLRASDSDSDKKTADLFKIINEIRYLAIFKTGNGEWGMRNGEWARESLKRGIFKMGNR